MNNPSMIKVGIIGGAGYTGGELIRLLLNHPSVQIAYVHSNSNGGNLISNVHTDLLGETRLKFTSDLSFLQNETIDLLFLCVGHGDAKKFLDSTPVDDRIKIIDLSQDFRLVDNSNFSTRSFVYGLPELNKTTIELANNIANPGCFATAIQLGLLPLANAVLLGQVYSTGITGSTGAGQSLSETSHFSWRVNNVSAYKTLQHQHLVEIHQSLHQLQAADDFFVHFVPWRGDFSRGIYVSSVTDCNLTLEEANELYQRFYNEASFTHISNKMIHLKQVVNTNKCLLFLEKQGNKLVIHSAIDNLLKGASGQAVQNMNLMFGLDETLGLQLKPSAF